MATASPIGYRRDLLLYAPATVVPAACSFGLLFLASYAFSPVVYGIYALAQATIALLLILGSWYSPSIIRLLPELERQTSPVGAAGTISRLAMATGIALVLLYTVVAVTFGYEARFAIAGGAFLLAMHGSATLLQYCSARREVARFSAVSIGRSALALVFAWLAVVAFGLGISALFWAQAAAAAICLVGARGPFLYRSLMAPAAAADERQVWRDFARLGLPLLGGNVAAWGLNLGDRYVIDHYVDAAAVGVYGFAATVTEQTLMLAAATFHQAQGPWIVQRHSDAGPSAAASAMSDGTRHYVLMFGLLAAAAALFGPRLLAAVSPAAYHSGFTVIPWSACAIFCFGLQQRFHFPFLLQKRAAVLGGALAVASAANLGLSVVLVSRVGFVGAAISKALSLLALAVVLAVLSRRVQSFSLPVRTLFVAGAGVAAMVGWSHAVALAGNGSLSVLVWIEAPVALALYLGTCVATGEITVSSWRRFVAPSWR